MMKILEIFNRLSFLISPLFYEVLFLSVSATLVGGVVLCFRKVFEKAISSFWKIGLWAVVLTAFLVPLRIQTEKAFMPRVSEMREVSYREEYRKEESKLFLRSKENRREKLETSGKKREKEELRELEKKVNLLFWKTFLLDEVFPAFWLVGSFFFFFSMVFGKWKLERRIKKEGYLTDEFSDLVEEAKEKLDFHGNVEIKLADFVDSPALVGVFRPRILLPSYVRRMEKKSLFYVILHELSHYKRRDMWKNLLLLGIQIIHWFNPFSWIMFRLVREDMEVLNDEYVLAHIEKGEKKEYAVSLVEVLGHIHGVKLMPRFLCMVDGKKNVERRIKMMKLSEKFRKYRILIGIVSLFVIVGLSLLFFTEKEKKENRIAKGIALTIQWTKDGDLTFSETVADGEEKVEGKEPSKEDLPIMEEVVKKILLKHKESIDFLMREMRDKKLTFDNFQEMMSTKEEMGVRMNAIRSSFLSYCEENLPKDKEFILEIYGDEVKARVEKGEDVVWKYRKGEGNLSEPEAELSEKVNKEENEEEKTRFGEMKENLLEKAFSKFSGMENRAFSEEELKGMEPVFSQIIPDEKGEDRVNPLCHFFAHEYVDVRNLNIGRFIWYFDGEELKEENQEDVKQFEALKELENFPFKSVETLKGAITPIRRVRAEEVEAVLRTYAGVGLDETEKGDVLYLKDYDSFYSYSSDFGVGYFMPTLGEVKDGMIRLNDGDHELILKKEEDGWKIQSFTYLVLPENSEYVGEYQWKEEKINTSLKLDVNEGKFYFMYHPAMSYWPNGNFYITRGNKLMLDEISGNLYEFVFTGKDELQIVSAKSGNGEVHELIEEMIKQKVKFRLKK